MTRLEKEAQHRSGLFVESAPMLPFSASPVEDRPDILEELVRGASGPDGEPGSDEWRVRVVQPQERLVGRQLTARPGPKDVGFCRWFRHVI